MYGEIPYKFKYMLNKIINCIMENILKYISNRLLLESKLILINNYIIDVFNSVELSKNNMLNNYCQNTPNNYSSSKINKSFSKKMLFPKYENYVTCSKLSNVFLNLSEKDTIENNGLNGKEKNSINNTPYKDKYKLNKLKILLKNEQEKSIMKELSYMKRLSFVQKKLDFYESIKNNNDKSKNTSEISSKNSPIKLDEESILKPKLNNSSLENMDYLAVINTCKNRGLNPFQKDKLIFNLKEMKHSMSHKKLFSINLRKKI